MISPRQLHRDGDSVTITPRQSGCDGVTISPRQLGCDRDSVTIKQRQSDRDGGGPYLAVTDAPVLLESLEDLVLAAEGGCGVEGQLLQVV